MEKAALIAELKLKAVRSSGAGGQHVNKVSTKVELAFDLVRSNAVTEAEKNRLLLKLGHRLTKEKILLLQCDETRSQHKNKELAIKRFLELLEGALKVHKKRKPSKPSKSSIERRLKRKKEAAQKKIGRRKFGLE